MLGFGWLALWKADRALRQGRLEDASALLADPASRDQKKASRLRCRLASAFVQRGQAWLDNRKTEAAWADLLRAETLEPSLDEAARLRQRFERENGSRLGDSPLVSTRVHHERGQRFLLWIDGIGGYLVCLGNAISLGRSTPDTQVDIPLLADVSRLHAHLIRDGEGYLIEGVRPVQVNNKPAARAMLHDSDRVTLGNSFQFLFHQPVPLSVSARLEIVSGHRMSLAVDAVLLMGETLILGPGTQSHVQSPDLKKAVILFRRKDGLGVRLAGNFRVNGQACSDRTELPLPATVTGDDIAFSVEWAQSV